MSKCELQVGLAQFKIRFLKGALGSLYFLSLALQVRDHVLVGFSWRRISKDWPKAILAVSPSSCSSNRRFCVLHSLYSANQKTCALLSTASPATCIAVIQIRKKTAGPLGACAEFRQSS